MPLRFGVANFAAISTSTAYRPFECYIGADALTRSSLNGDKPAKQLQSWIDTLDLVKTHSRAKPFPERKSGPGSHKKVCVQRRRAFFAVRRSE